MKVRHVTPCLSALLFTRASQPLLPPCLSRLDWPLFTAAPPLHYKDLQCLPELENRTPSAMAILASRPEIKISIICDGAPLQEYDDHDDHDEELPATVISKYIEAVSGAEFGIQWQISSPWPPHSVMFEYWLDQKEASGECCTQVNYKGQSYTYTEEGAITVVDGQSYLHKFAFAALDVGMQALF